MSNGKTIKIIVDNVRSNPKTAGIKCAADLVEADKKKKKKKRKKK